MKKSSAIVFVLAILLALQFNISSFAFSLMVYEETENMVDTSVYVNYEETRFNLHTAVYDKSGNLKGALATDSAQESGYLRTTVGKGDGDTVKSFLWSDAIRPLQEVQTPGNSVLANEDITIKLNNVNISDFTGKSDCVLGNEYILDVSEHNFEYFPKVEVNVSNPNFVAEVVTSANTMKQVVNFYSASRIAEKKTQLFSSTNFTLNYERYVRPLIGTITISYTNKNQNSFEFKGLENTELFETTDNVHYKNKGLKGLELCTIPGNSQYAVADGINHRTIYNTEPLTSNLGTPVVGSFPAYTVYSGRSGLGNADLGVGAQSVATGAVVSYPDGFGLDNPDTRFIGPSIWSDGARVTSSSPSIHSDKMTYADLYIKYNVDLYRFTPNKICEVMVFATKEHTGYNASNQWRKLTLIDDDALKVVRMNSSFDVYKYVYTRVCTPGEEVTITTPGNDGMLITFVKPINDLEKPALASLAINGEVPDNFSPDVYEYTYPVGTHTISAPSIYAEPLEEGSTVTVDNPKEFPGSAHITVYNKYGMSAKYTVNYIDCDASSVIEDLHKDAAKVYKSIAINNNVTTGNYGSCTFTDLDLSSLEWQYPLDVKHFGEIYDTQNQKAKMSVVTDRNGLPGGNNASGNPNWGAIVEISDNLKLDGSRVIRGSWDMISRGGYHHNTDKTLSSETPTLADIWRYKGSRGLDFYSFRVTRSSKIYIVSETDISDWTRFYGFKRVDGAYINICANSQNIKPLAYVYERIVDKDSRVVIKSPGASAFLMTFAVPIYEYEGDNHLREPVRADYSDAFFEDFTYVTTGSLPDSVHTVATNVYTEEYEVLPGYKKNCLVLNDVSYDKAYNGVDATIDFEPQSGITEVSVRYKYIKPEECPYASFVVGLWGGDGMISRTAVASANGLTYYNYGYNDESLLESSVINSDAWYKLTYIINFDSTKNKGYIDVILHNEKTNTKRVLYYADFCDDKEHNLLSSLTFSTAVYGGKYVIDYVRVRQVDSTLENSGVDPYEGIKKGTEQTKTPIPESHAVEGRLNITLDGKYKYTTKEPYVAENGSFMLTAKNLAEIFNLGYFHSDMKYTITADESTYTFEANSDMLAAPGAVVKLKDKSVLRYGQLFVSMEEFCSLIGKETYYDKTSGTFVISSSDVKEPIRE